ncbi:hypothetical protein Tco_0267563 [Tanacetum coccineum]
MKVIIGDFMQLSSEVTRRLKEKLMEEVSRIRKIKKITKYPDIKVLGPLVGHKSSKNPVKKAFLNNLNSIPTGPLCIRYVHLVLSSPPRFQKRTFDFKPVQTMSKRARSTRGQSSSSQDVSLEEKIRRLGVFKNGVHQMHHDALTRRRIHSGDIIDWEFLASQGLDQAFFESINKDPFSGPQWVNLFQINENVYRELVREFFASFEFNSSPCRYDPNHLGVRFRLGGEQREISLLELGWRVGLYSERQSRESATLSGLRKGVTVKANHLLGFWPTFGDGGFNIGNTKVTAIRDPKVKLAHCCITTTIAGRKESTHRVTEIDLFYLYCIYSEGVICNIPYWLAKLLTNEMMGTLSVEPSPHVFKKKSFISMGVVMKQHNRACFWPASREVEEEDDDANEAVGGDAGNEGARGSDDMYHNMNC